MKARITTSPMPGTFRRNPYWKLQALFRERGFHDYEIADALGISAQCLSRYIRGSAQWRGDAITGICKFLHIPQEQVGYYFFPELGKETTNA